VQVSVTAFSKSNQIKSKQNKTKQHETTQIKTKTKTKRTQVALNSTTSNTNECFSPKFVASADSSGRIIVWNPLSSYVWCVVICIRLALMHPSPPSPPLSTFFSSLHLLLLSPSYLFALCRFSCSLFFELSFLSTNNLKTPAHIPKSSLPNITFTLHASRYSHTSTTSRSSQV
jgi:hypothetical protein